MTSKKKQYKSYESAIERLEEITQSLESGDTPLEEAIDLYTEGLEIVKFCSMKLNEAEKKIKVITEENGLFAEENYDTQDKGD